MPSAAEPSFSRRYRAPRNDRAFLAEPRLEDVPELVERNRAQRSCWSACPTSQFPWRELAASTRAELLAAAKAYSGTYLDPAPQNSDGPLIMAGHQPGMFHPGVWCKNFLISSLAQQLGGVAINLVINTDTLRQPTLRVPAGDPSAPRWETIPFDRGSEEFPFEERAILDRRCFASFAERAQAMMRGLVPKSLLDTYWPLARERAEASGNLGRALAESRHQLERRWGLATWELPWSDVLELPSMRLVTGLMLADSCRLRGHYNEAVLAYRRAYRVRSRNHPAPLLELNADWCETPYRLWRAEEPHRRRLFVRKQAGTLQLTDRAGWTADIPAPKSPEDTATAEALGALAAQGVKIRTRALATTLYARTLLADLFIHGIGGGLYDQVTDRWMHAAWGIAPTEFLVATATLYLPLNVAKASNGHGDTRAALRNLTYHPERFLTGRELPPDAREAIAEKQRWIATEQTKENARERCRAIRQANETLRPLLQPEREGLAFQREQEARRRQTQQVLRWREYGFPLYPEAILRDFLLEIPDRNA